MPQAQTKHITTKASLTADGEEQGLIEAVFSVFDMIDSDGDVVTRSAFTNGQTVPMVWSHNWDMPIGKGKIRVEQDRAVFKGQLWLDTDDGLQAFRRIKNAAELQEYSWGFQITDAEPGKVDGRDVRFIKGTELFEVSPVLVGANRQTQTLALKNSCPTCAEKADSDTGETVPDEGKDGELAELQDCVGAALTVVDELIALAGAAPLQDDTEREALKAALGRLDLARNSLSAALKRTDPATRVEPRNQYRRFRELSARAGLHLSARGGN